MRGSRTLKAPMDPDTLGARLGSKAVVRAARRAGGVGGGSFDSSPGLFGAHRLSRARGSSSLGRAARGLLERLWLSGNDVGAAVRAAARVAAGAVAQGARSATLAAPRPVALPGALPAAVQEGARKIGARLGAAARAAEAARTGALRAHRARVLAHAARDRGPVKPSKPRKTSELGRERAPVSSAPKPRKASGAAERRGFLPLALLGQDRRIFRQKPKVKERLEAIEALPPPFRIRVVMGVLGLTALVILGRSAELQLFEGGRYRAYANHQGSTEKTITGRRGRILDRHGAELANTIEAESVFADRDRIADPKVVARRLAPILGIPYARLLERLDGHRGFVFLRRRASPAVASAVRALGVEGVGLVLEPRRMYGNVKLAAHVLGFVDVDGQGRAGIERSLQGELRGQDARVPSVADALRRAVWSDGFDEARGVDGRDVVLTLDRHVQYVAEEVLERTVSEHRAKGAVAIVLDARTSEVLALASHPTFNPNNLSGSTVSDRKNRAIASIFDPGSTAKIVTIAAALESGTATADTQVDCEEGRWRVGNRTIRDASHAYGVLTVAEVMKKSSNIGAGKLALRMGSETLHDFLVRFGMGRLSGIELPGEVPGLLRPPKQWRDVDLVNIAFGQGLSVTPLQIAQAANVVAAGGVLRAPTLLRGAGLVRDGSLPEPTARPGQRVISKETAKAITQMMAEVTSPDGTAPKAAVPGFTVAGKTGTAQKYDPALGAYSKERYVASFVGFLPAEAPELTVLVLVDEPRGSIYGGQVAGPAFHDIAIAALASKDLYPSDPGLDASVSTVRADPGAETRGDPEVALERAMVELTAEAASGVSRVLKDSGEIDAELSPRARALLAAGLPKKGSSRAREPEGRRREAPKAKRMPDLRGLNAAEAATRCAELALDPVLTGRGRVHRQAPRPGAVVAPGARCTLELGRDG